MNDILCIEVDAVATTDRPPLAPEGPFSQLSKTGRWALMRDEALDLLKMDDATKSQIRASRKVFMPPEAFTDFFGPAKEGASNEDQHVWVS